MSEMRPRGQGAPRPEGPTAPASRVSRCRTAGISKVRLHLNLLHRDADALPPGCIAVPMQLDARRFTCICISMPGLGAASRICI